MSAGGGRPAEANAIQVVNRDTGARESACKKKFAKIDYVPVALA